MDKDISFDDCKKRMGLIIDFVNEKMDEQYAQAGRASSIALSSLLAQSLVESHLSYIDEFPEDQKMGFIKRYLDLLFRRTKYNVTLEIKENE